MRAAQQKLTVVLEIFCLLFSTSFLTSCAIRQGQQQRTGILVSKYANYARENLQPNFQHAGIHYPPKQIVLLAYKRSRRLQLWARGKGTWRYIKTFPILAASGGSGPKLHNHDRQVPEGIYHIIEFNPNSHFHLSMELNYPNEFDRYHAQLDGRTDLGDNIFIHGSHYSIGCIAIGNDAINQLFVLSYLVGLGHIKVIIAPNDLRYYKPVYGHVHPRWLLQLYRDIRQALTPFKGHA